MSPLLLVALTLFCFGRATRPVAWIRLPCPGAVASSSCSYQNPSSSEDMAVSLFFQVEDTAGTASFQCKSGTVVHCARSWQSSEQGSAGTCFFLLRASQSFECSGQGKVNVLGAHGATLASSLLSSDVQQVPCTGALTTCSYKNKGTQDQWLSMTFSTSAENDGLSCQMDQHTVCSFKGTSANDVSSCTFLLPIGSEMSCKATVGSPVINSVVAVSLEKQLSPVGKKVASTCPPTTGSKTTLCDCSYANPTDHDMIVVMNAMQADNKFNSFHCAVSGVNTCAWGANNGENSASGQCSFILPAGASYSCQMQWGATAFPSVTVLPLSAQSIYPASRKPAPETIKSQHAPGVTFVPSTRSDTNLRQLFDEFQSQHGTIDQARFKNFAQFVALTDNHPSNPPLRHGSELSPLAVLSQDEFEATHRNCAKCEEGIVRWSGLTEGDVRSTPATIDWRTKGAVTPVKDQGRCGSCWTFSTTGLLEGAWAIAGHGLTQLSEQNLVSCDNKDGNAGCGGGWPWKAIDFVHANGGIDLENSYPYTSGSGTVAACAASRGTRADVRVVNHTIIESNEDKMAAWVAKNGPLSVSLDAMTQIWWPYRGGIVNTCCNTEADHAVLIVGFGEENGQKYWLIKNSWNANWGEKGYIRLERGTNQCGITFQPVGAIVGAPGPAPPPSPPTPPPTPSSDCPSDAAVVSTPQGKECRWMNGTSGLEMPPKPTEYCDYIAQGYFGYLWDKAQGSHACAATAQSTSTADSYFCVWRDGQAGVKIPKGSIADCSTIAQGKIGFVLPRITEFVV